MKTPTLGPRAPSASALKTEWNTLEFHRRRLQQVAGGTLAALVPIGLAYAAVGKWAIAMAFVTGVLGTAFGWWYGLKHQSQRGFALIMWAVWATVSYLMWLSDALRDVALLAYPLILIMAGLLVGRRVFLQLLVAMLLFATVMTLATEVLGWRHNTRNNTEFELLRDVWVMLLAGAYAVWGTVSDWRKMTEALEVQIEGYRQSQAQLTYLSQHDALTGLPNRSLGRHQMEVAIEQARLHQGQVALMFVDLDNFKSINDTVGHSAGDQFLQQIAERLRAAVRASDIVMRQSGDEFLVGLLDVPDSATVRRAADEVLAHLGGVYQVLGTELSSSCSIGVALYPSDGGDFDTLLRHADLAMYKAKQAGRNSYRFFDVAMQDDMSASPRLVAELQTALARHEFVLHYQPVVDMRDRRLLGCEALIRWQHPQRGLLGPAEFILAAERSGLIVDIGRWVLAESCRQTALWQQAGPPLTVAVNISPVQFHRGGLEGAVQQALDASGLPPHCLELEITESVLMGDAATLTDTIRSLKALGVSIAIDDFGTGYSNLGYLQRFAADKIKIDQSFVRGVLTDPGQQVIVAAIVQMGLSLQMVPHAEGVEAQSVRDVLLGMGCATGQGYYFGRPVPPESFAASYF
ncbi:COG5001 Predicted signal transduction protein containing a membrane domain, an EAL and a GGDEF domain [Comamonadaceae bacterium]